ncbi:MAG: outer membrane lipoprotein carrier protein LolA [Rhodobacteraceae bacterium]|nr:outer membrane lipoprotein carrier protein LolA [Paracoccaceae bacterium]
MAYIVPMHRRALLVSLAALALALAPRAGRAVAIPLDALSAYVNGLTTAETTFTQVNGDGTLATGRLWLHRPGRIRFEYDPPDGALVIAAGGQVAVFDPKSNQPPEQYPLARTPLGLILAANVDLARARMVLSHREEGPTTRVLAQDPERPEYGTIELVFTAGPVELRQWIVRDDAGAETTVILGALVRGGAIPARTFDLEAEIGRRQNR